MASLTNTTKEVHGIPGPQIDVRAIERELASLWAVPQAVMAGGVEVFPTRTSVLNLVIYAPNEELAERATQLIESLATFHPSRVIIFSVVSDPHAFDTDIDAVVTSYCHVDAPEHVAACVEQISIAVLPDQLNVLPSVIAPLTLPDLPTFLWWMGQPPLNDTRFDKVLLAADRLMLDSFEFTRPLSSLVREAEFCTQVGSVCVISDLNWARLTEWRETVAQFFDIPDCRWALEYISRLEIRYGHTGGSPDNPTQALLFIGWMSDRLGWQVESAEVHGVNKRVFTVAEPGGRTVVVEMAGRPAPREFEGHILAVNVTAGDGVKSASLEASRVGDLAVIRMVARTDGQLRVERAIQSPPPGLHNLLIEELEYVVRDRIFERALQEAKHYAEWLRNQARS